METNWKGYPPHSPWSGLCCNVFMDNFSNSPPERPPLFAYQHLTDLSFCTETAQSSLNISNFYHQSRLSLSSCTSHHPYFPSCCPNSSNDSAFRPITLSSLPEPRPFWYPPHLDSYSGHFGNGLYRFLPSASQSSLTPLSPAPDYVPFFGNTSFLSHYSPTSSKNSGISCSPDHSRLSSSSLSSTIISPAEPLTIRVKSEPFGTLSSHSIQSMTPEMSSQNSVESEVDLCRTSSIFSETNEANQTTQGCLSRNSRVNKTFRKFGAKVKPLQKDETNFYASIKSDSKSGQNQSVAESSIEVISKNDSQNLISNSLRSSPKPLDTAIEVIPCAITSKVESSMRRNLYLDSYKSSGSFDSIFSDSTNSVKSKSSKILSPVRPHSSKISKSIHSSSSSSSPLSASPSDNLFPTVPIGIAVARKRQSSSNKYNDDINKSPSQKILPSDSSGSIKKVIKMSNEGTEIKPDSSLHINTAAVTIAPDYRLARDDLTGQFFLFPNASNYFPSQLTSVITNPTLSIQPMSSLNQSNTLNPESNFLTITNQYPRSSNLSSSEDVPRNTVTEQAIQACMSDEESENLVINENLDTNVSNKVTSACQVDMDLEMKDETKCLNNDTSTTTMTLKKSPNVKSNENSVLFDENEDEKIPTLPVDSKEVINFINVRGFDLLVDSIERANKNNDESKKETSSSTEDSNCDRNKKKSTLEVDLVDHNPSSFTDGLKLLSALAEQRAIEEEENIQDCKRRHSTDCKSGAEVSNTESSKQNKAGFKRKQRSESSSGCLHLSKKSTSDETNSESPSAPSCTKKRKRENTEFNPWTIRRSERIFLHEAFQQVTTPSNQLGTKLKESVPITKKANNNITTKKNVNNSNVTIELVTKGEDENVFKLTKKELKNDLRVLLKKDDLLYAGSLNTIEPPDIYEIKLDGQKNPNRNVYSRDDLLREAIKEVKPNTITELNEGKRVCAYWSQQYKCLYSGTVARCSSPQPLTKKNLVFIEFDDGDKSKISLDNIRLLPQDFPLQTINNKSQKHKQVLKSSSVSKSSVKKDDKVCSKNGKSKASNDKDLSSEEDEKVDEEEEKEKKEKEEKEEKEEEKKKKEDEDENEDEDETEDEDGDEKEIVRRKSKMTAKSLPKKVSKTNKKVVKVNDKPNHGNKRTVTQNKKETNVQDDKVKNNNSKTKDDRKEKLVKRDKNVAATSKTKLINFEKNKTVERQLWQWSGRDVKKQGAKNKAKKILYKEIKRGKEAIKIGDCAVFLSSGRPHLPYVGRIDSLWQSGNGNMTVNVKWFYHPEETKTKPALVDPQGALFESYHFDQNDVQTISHKCLVLSWPEYQKQLKDKSRMAQSVDSSKIYYLAGDYDPLSGKMHIVPGIPLHTS